MRTYSWRPMWLESSPSSLPPSPGRGAPILHDSSTRNSNICRSRYRTLLQLLRQRNTVKVKETNLAREPERAGILVGATIQEGLVHFRKKTFVPLAVHMPVLHGVRNVRGLDEVFTITIVALRSTSALVCSIMEGQVTAVTVLCSSNAMAQRALRRFLRSLSAMLEGSKSVFHVIVS
jgi:hypothetical protein